MLGLTTLAVFILSGAAFGTLSEAPDLTSGIRQISFGAVMLIFAVFAALGLLLVGGAFARIGLAFGGFFTIVAWMVLSTAGDQGPAIVLFGLLAGGAPTLLIALLRRLL